MTKMTKFVEFVDRSDRRYEVVMIFVSTKYCRNDLRLITMNTIITSIFVITTIETFYDTESSIFVMLLRSLQQGNEDDE